MVQKKILVVIAAYNEARTLASVLSSLARYNYQVVVVDDGSTDETARIASNYDVVLIRHSVNLGQGAALETGMEYARRNNADIVVTYDADGQFEAEDIKRMIEPVMLGQADVALGSRFLGKAQGVTFVRKFILKLGIVFTYIFSDIILTDTHNGLRAFNNKSIHNIKISHNRMSHASEILDKIKKNRLRYVEIPVTVRYDMYTKIKGQSSINFINIVYSLIFEKLI